ncbi:hypothetical protein PLESTB_000374500 [Pleodorina starrii]|uniref:PAS domain-containing protein n=1 Tax=Pleodorina starrii TaxID=330485 RepID=A0A9W6BDX8_9CHLO|nr:hypothetical protein PLESTM_000020400 [Pleodorina starrii]GLC50396.1 hypothetical protein PLESTB_000374500 [Pleodorina starrii]GLC64223.1 hypothetical protein PLESTF_000138200 [Pleodorina starrii]
MSEHLSRSSSFSSVGSGANSVASDARSMAGGGGGDVGANDLLEQNQTVQAAVFGVLYTLAKEKLDRSKRFAVARLVLDFLQCFILIVNPAYGWSIDTAAWYWKAVKWVHFSNPIVAKGYHFFVSILYSLAAALAVSVVLCVWVGWCFKNDRFPYVWPIKMLRIVVATFFVVFYVGSLAIFMVALSCRWFDPDDNIRFHLRAFPDVKCLAMPHLVHGAVALGCSVVFCFIAFAMTVADFEMNPASRRWLSAPHARVEVRGLMVKTIMTVTVAVLAGLTRVQAVILSATSAFLFWSYVRWEPHFIEWINHIRAGLYAMVSWAGMVLLVLTFSPHRREDDFRSKLTTVMVAGLLPVLAVGFLISFIRLRISVKLAIRSFCHIDPNKSRLKDIYRFPDAMEVEIVSRVARKWTEDDVLDTDAVKLAETIIKVGLAQFHDDVFLTITYSNFLIEVQNNYQSGVTQLQQAKKLEPPISDRFAIFVREQEHKQKAQSQSSGESAVDLVSYVEFQRNYRLLLRAHKSALYATRHFWKQLLHHDVSFNALARAFRQIEVSKTKADRTYKMVLDRYPSSVKLLRSYGRFLEEVKNDPWTAAKYYSEADKVEEQQENAANDAMLSDAVGDGDPTSMLAQVDEKNNAVAVINAVGIIQMANKPLMKLFGYKKGELEGKNISILMPQPFSQRHNGYLRNYTTTGKAKILDTIREVVAIHKDRFVFPLKIAVTKVSGTGADSLFMGVLKPAEDDPGTVHAWMMTQGTILCVDQRFSDWFGRSPNEVVGRPFNTLATEQDVLIKLLDLANASTEAEFQEGRVSSEQVHLLHKYTEPVACRLKITLGGTDSQRIFVVHIKRVRNDQTNMMVTDHKGRIMYMNTDLASALGYTPKQAVKMDISQLMSHPYSQLHYKYMKEPPAKVPLQSCRNAATVVMLDAKKQSVPVKPHLSIREENDVITHVVNVEFSTWERGLDERRLSLVVDETGVVQSVSDTPMGVFGIKPTSMVGHSIAEYVDALSPLRAQLPEILKKMMAVQTEKPGYTWRVGVHPPVDEAALASASAVAQAILAKNTRPALMGIEVKPPANEGELPTITVSLSKADMVTGVVMVDHNMVVLKPNCCVLHPTGLCFGVSNQVLMKRKISQFLDVPHNVHSEWLLSDHKVKGAMKTGTTGRKIGPTRVINGFHEDGQPLQLRMTAVAHENKRVNVKLNFAAYWTGNTEVFMRTLSGEASRTQRATDGFVGLGQTDPKTIGRSGRRVVVANTSVKGGVKWAGDAGGGGSGGGDDKSVKGGRKEAALPQSPTNEKQDGNGNSDDGRKSDDGSLSDSGSGGSGGGADDADGADGKQDKLDALADPAAADGGGGWGGGAANGWAQNVDDDQASGVSGSQVDGASVVSGSEAGGYQTDFKRGRRFKKLMKLLSSVKAKADLTRFNRHTYIVMAVLLLVHVVCFALFLVFLENQKKYVTEVDATQDASTHGLDVAILARALDNVYKNRTNPDWYTWNDLNTILNDMTFAIDAMENEHQGLYLGFGQLRHLGDVYELGAVWEGRTLNDTTYIDTRNPYTVSLKNSLWLMGNAFIASAREIVSNHIRIANATKNNFMLNRDWQYINLNGPASISLGYRLSLNGMVLRTWDSVGRVNMLGIGLLVAEGCVVCGAAALYMWILLKQVARQRYGLYSVFLVIPTGFLRALASKHVQVDGEDDNDSDSDAGDDANANKERNAGGNKDSGGKGEGDKQGEDEGKPVILPAGIKARAVVVEVGDAGEAPQPLWRRTLRGITSAVGLFDSRGRGGLGAGVDTGKRKLTRDNRDTVVLTVPFLLWGAVVIAIYTFSYLTLKKVAEPLVNLDVANRVKTKINRCVFTAQEVISQTDDAARAAWQAELLIRQSDLEMFYDALLYGSSNLPEMAFSHTQGTLFSGAAPAEMFFRSKDLCYVTEDSDRWCFPEGHMYHEVSANALDPMIRRLIEEALLLGNDALTDLTFNSSRFDYIWRVAYHQLIQGAWAANSIYASAANANFGKVRMAHIILFVLSLALCLLFLIFMFRPFIRRTAIEARQVAELLSQLPPEMDVEGLVASAMTMRRKGDEEDEPGVAAAGMRRSVDGRVTKGAGGRRSSMEMRQSDTGAAGGGGGGKKGRVADDEDDASSIGSSMG